MKRALVLGEGQIGRAVAETLFRDGWRVVVGRRSAPSALLHEPGRFERVLLDRDDPEAFEALLARGFEAAVDTVAFTAAHARQWSRGRASVNALVVISSGSVYADAAGRTLDEARTTGFPNYPVPLREDQRRTSPGEETYSTQKVAMEDALLNETRIPATILRPFAVYGPGSRSPREWWFLVRALAGQRRIPLAFEGRSRFQTSATANIAELCRLALGRPATRVLNAADPHALTVLEIGQAVSDALQLNLSFDLLPGNPQGYLGRTPWTLEGPIVADMSAAAATLGYRPVTDYRRFVGQTCEALMRAVENNDWREAFPALAAYPPEMFEPDRL